MKALICAAALLMAGCGGGGAPAGSAPVVPDQAVVLVNASDSIASADGYALSVYPTREPDPAASVYQQGKQTGKLVLWPGDTKQQGFADFRRYVDAAILNPAFGMVYLYDELFWHHQTGLALGLDEGVILDAARYAKSKGLKPAVSVLPAVLLHPDFRLAEINAFDVIGVNIYPSIPAGNGDCNVTGNPYAALLKCSVDRLRGMGFAGDVWYITQAFGLHSQDPAEALAQIRLQQQAVAQSAALGVTAIVPWGQLLAAAEIAREPDLFQGRGSTLDPYLNLPTSRNTAAFFTPIGSHESR